MSQDLSFGGHSMVGDLQTVLVKQPDYGFGIADAKIWNYAGTVNLPHAQMEHQDLVRILEKNGVKVVYHVETMNAFADSIYVHDPVLMTDWGAILLKMSKPLRQGEEVFMKKRLQELNIPILHEVSEPGFVEGGDLLWLDHRTLIAGRGYRTNLPGILQIRDVLQAKGVNILSFDLPSYQGKKSCLHLQGLISLVDVKVAVAYVPLLPAPFVQHLENHGFEIIEVTESEFQNMGTNILTIKPRVVVMVSGNASLQRRLEDRGIEVHTYKGDEISLKAEGGPTCLTRPLKRASLPDSYGPVFG